MGSLVLLLGLVAWSPGVNPTQTGPTRERAAALAAKAEDHAAAGRLADALRAMEEAERAAPGWAELKVNLAALRSEAGDYAGAIAAARAALAIDRTLEGAWFNLGLAQLKSGDAAAAAATLERFASRTDAPPVALAALGLALLQTERVTDSAEALQRATDAGLRDPDVLTGLVVTRLRLKEPDAARAAARLLVEATPRDASALLLLGDAEDARHDWPAAEIAYRSALAIDPAVPRGHYSLGLSLYKQRRYVEAATEFDRELTIAPQYAPALRYRAELELDRGNPDAAIPFLLKLTAAAPADADGWRLLGRARLDQARAGDAIVALEHAVRLNAEDPSAQFMLGRALAGAGRRAEADAAFARAAELNQRLRDRLEGRVSGKKKSGGGLEGP